MDPDFFRCRPMLEGIAGAFMRVFHTYSHGRERRLAVSLPPRGGKSYTTTLFITWMRRRT